MRNEPRDGREESLGTEGARGGALGVRREKGWQPCLEVVYYKCHIQVGFAELHPSRRLSLSGKSPEVEDGKHGQL